MKYIILSIISIISFFYNYSEPKITFSGSVIDKSSGVFIYKCLVKAKDNSTGISYETFTDKDGKFKINLAKGSYTVEFLKNEYVLYKTIVNFKSVKDTTFSLAVSLTPFSTKKEVKKVIKIDKLAKSPSKKSRGYSGEATLKYGDETGLSGASALSISESYEGIRGERTKYTSDDVPKNLKAGVLTAGEINDFSKWVLWNDLSEGELKKYVSNWMILPRKRFSVLVTNQNKSPLYDLNVFLKNDKNEIVWQSKTDNTGKAELWADLFDSSTVLRKNFSLEVFYNNKTYKISKAKLFEDGINNITINTSCDKKNNVDIVFAVDATGSMGDEISYLQTELYDVIEKIKLNNAELNLRMGSLFYRDKDDEYLTREQNLTNDINKVIDFIKAQSANGGGDEPEAVEAAFEKIIENFDWSSQARARIMFLVLDASPHQNKEVIEKIHNYTVLAAKMGIRIVPIVCSGIDKSGEYLMRSIALATNGNYVFLTDNSGIGNPHIKPSTDKFEVETLNKLLIRLIQQYIFIPECNNSINTALIDSLQNNKPDSFSKDTSFIDNSALIGDTTKSIENIYLKYYPNPCKGILYVESNKFYSDIFITDINGKIILKIVPDFGQKYIQIDLSQFPSGIYFIRYNTDKKYKAGKFVLIH
ncbi:MAG: carboxypeptidase regulatory-like domain-containing protein [Bacteroidetes bacterium]|nr:carboxypeptidase regulatory-like domain-containing protein [Bacteroidota bacterium]